MKNETYPELEEGERFFIGGEMLYKIPLSKREMMHVLVCIEESIDAPSNFGHNSTLSEQDLLQINKKVTHYFHEINREDMGYATRPETIIEAQIQELIKKLNRTSHLYDVTATDSGWKAERKIIRPSETDSQTPVAHLNQDG